MKIKYTTYNTIVVYLFQQRGQDNPFADYKIIKLIKKLKIMKTELKQNTERIYCLTNKIIDGEEKQIESGYIHELENGNFLVYCGGNEGLMFNELLFNAVKSGLFGKVINTEHVKETIWNGKECTQYFYEVEHIENITVVIKSNKVFDRVINQKIAEL